jgi:hypothetical protein
MSFRKDPVRAATNLEKKELRQVDAREAMSEYIATGAAAHKNTARLRALRLARDAAGTIAAEPVKPTKSTKKKPA